MDQETRPGALDRALASLEWTLGMARRTVLAAGRWTDLPAGSGAFHFASSGSAEVRAGAQRWSLAAGDLLLIGAGRRHELHATGDTAVISGFFDHDEPGRQVMAFLPETVAVPGFAGHEPELAGLIEQLVCAPEAARAGEALICGQIASAVLSAAVRSWAERGLAPERWLQRFDDPLVARAVDAIRTDPGRGWTVDELAREATMSRSAFAEQFRVVVGRSPAAYLTAVRVQRGMELLAQGASIADVARRMGYESEAGFRRAFRRHTGTNPASWRQTAVAG
ncbi:AraC family transcriptional regulator [Saccharopolyspora indica]|uniref:AraC family transcriptional regulator n=1 Tax=Saccharopolyspora indica TaxID=1229659 RepID=UPI0022EB967D|nr:AraC family transcriptional regulator [Saccharopolyspora indica]MDA3644638.1 AraC family transcriptional regulator [Saccharopolyspora indica]